MFQATGWGPGAHSLCQLSPWLLGTPHSGPPSSGRVEDVDHGKPRPPQAWRGLPMLPSCTLRLGGVYGRHDLFLRPSLSVL